MQILLLKGQQICGSMAPLCCIKLLLNGCSEGQITWCRLSCLVTGTCNQNIRKRFIPVTSQTCFEYFLLSNQTWIYYNFAV